jgi:hypothetical protein
MGLRPRLRASCTNIPERFLGDVKGNLDQSACKGKRDVERNSTEHKRGRCEPFAHVISAAKALCIYDNEGVQDQGMQCAETLIGLGNPGCQAPPPSRPIKAPRRPVLGGTGMFSPVQMRLPMTTEYLNETTGQYEESLDHNALAEMPADVNALAANLLRSVHDEYETQHSMENGLTMQALVQSMYATLIDRNGLPLLQNTATVVAPTLHLLFMQHGLHMTHAIVSAVLAHHLLPRRATHRALTIRPTP